ncbi:dihydrofolate reductase [Gracilibacillus caseinilyticus]|uniref:Dihydrofolate reductase n=1 Tax=Gracilibacillus caseinilyticus TaxID=2932256 RepID=A0ABY4ETT5_9BACI|nr:dihydrofolate reductase [Gracilibacillus caseinilyticus]UOQ47623.1 dihydrofolate reductase [Gracilibacillus caseinilyticus]
MISLLFAMGSNRVIGKDNDLPWHLPKDLKFFKDVTINQTIIMGRKTFESMNGPLPKRENIIVTRDKNYTATNSQVIHSIADIQQLNEEQPDKEWFVIGGEYIFEQVLPFADRIYMTYIDETFDGDTFFPEFDESDWHQTKKEKGIKDENNNYDYYFIQYDRKKS